MHENDVNEWSLDELVEKFIDYKCSQGYSYEHDIYHLQSFQNFCATNDCNGIPGKREFQMWMKQKPTELPQSQHRRVASVRAFHRYLHQIGLNTGYILPKNRLSGNLRCRPHFFSVDEIQLFFYECDKLTARKENPGREIILPTAFRLLYCCGLRPIEVLRLKNEHINLQEGYIDILESKKHKDRRLYLNHELISYISKYQQKIDNIWHGCTYFLPKNINNGFGRDYLRSNFKLIWNKVHNETTAPTVRLYDLRHNYAFSNLNRWIQEGKDSEVMILYLMKAMGHASVESTYYYLHLMPDFFPTYSQIIRKLSSVLPEVDHET